MIGYVKTLPPSELSNLPKGAKASPAIQHHGGACPVHPLQPVSIWWQSMNGAWWNPVNTASQHDWSEPCIYRTREPKPGHPLLREMRRNDQPAMQITTPVESIASDFSRLVDAIENYLARQA